MDEHPAVILEILVLADAYDRAVRLWDDGEYSICSQPTEFPVPEQPTPEEDALRGRLQQLSRDQQAAVQAAFWLGRDHMDAGDYPGLLESSKRNLDRVDRYLMSTTALAPSLRRAVVMLTGR